MLAIAIANSISSQPGLSGTPTPPSYGPYTTAFLNKIRDDGNDLTPTELSYLAYIEDQLTGGGLIDYYNPTNNKFNAIYPMVGGLAATHKYNFLNAQDLDSSYRLQFFGGWTHSSTGAKPNGVNAYAKTFFYPNIDLNLTTNNFAVYSGTNSSALKGDIGSGNNAFDAAFGIYLGNPTYNDNGNASAATGRTIYTNADTRGFYINTRLSSSMLKSYKNGALVAMNISTDSPGSNPFQLMLAAINYNNNAIEYSPREQRMAMIGSKSLSASDCALLYTTMQAAQTILGRQVSMTSEVPYTDAFVSRVVSDGNTLSANEIDYLSYMEFNFSVNGFINHATPSSGKFKIIYPMVGGIAGTHKYNFLDPRDLDVAYRLQFYGGWTHSSTGAKGNGVNGYADTYIYPQSVLNPTNISMFKYNRGVDNSNFLFDAGCYAADADTLNLCIYRGYGNASFADNALQEAVLNSPLTGTDTIQNGLIGITRGNSLDTAFYKRNTSLGVTLYTIGGTGFLPDIKMFLSALNNNGTAIHFTVREISLFFVGTYITPSEESIAYGIIQAAQTILNRQV